MIRNYLVFDKLIFMKSNLYFDAYFANYERENGIPDGPFFKKNHPAWKIKKDSNYPYIKLGERKFLETYKEKFFRELKKNPYTYIRNIKNRLFAALFVYYTFHTNEKCIAWKTVIHALPFVFIILIRIPCTV